MIRFMQREKNMIFIMIMQILSYLLTTLFLTHVKETHFPQIIRSAHRACHWQQDQTSTCIIHPTYMWYSIQNHYLLNI